MTLPIGSHIKATYRIRHPKDETEKSLVREVEIVKTGKYELTVKQGTEDVLSEGEYEGTVWDALSEGWKRFKENYGHDRDIQMDTVTGMNGTRNGDYTQS